MRMKIHTTIMEKRMDIPVEITIKLLYEPEISFFAICMSKGNEISMLYPVCITAPFKHQVRTSESPSTEEWTKKSQDVCRVLCIAYVIEHYSVSKRKKILTRGLWLNILVTELRGIGLAQEDQCCLVPSHEDSQNVHKSSGGYVFICLWVTLRSETGKHKENIELFLSIKCNPSRVII